MNDFVGLIMAQTAAPTETGTPAAAPSTPAAAPADSSQPQTTTQTTAPGDQTAVPAKPNKGLLDSMLLPMVLIFVVLYIFMLRGPRKKQQQHKQMLDNLKKGDHIRTIGGILATVVDVRDNEVVIKVDEATNTKIRVLRSAIGEVYAENKVES